MSEQGPELAGHTSAAPRRGGLEIDPNGFMEIGGSDLEVDGR